MIRNYFFYVLFFITTCLGQKLRAQDTDELTKLLNTPYISQLTVGAAQKVLAYTVNEAGKRNVYISDGKQGSAPFKITGFNEDDGQEITSLQFTADGSYLVFSRGGDHGANSTPRAVNPGSSISPAEIAVYAVHISSGKLTRIDAGDYPVVHPSANQIIYSKAFQLWQYDLDGTGKPAPLFQVKGSVSGAVWAPDGKRLAFVSRRGSHSFIGVYARGESRIRWIAPSFYRDHSPRWSPNGNSIAFIRQRATGGERDSITAQRNNLWQIVSYNLVTERATTIYTSPNQKQAAYPRIAGGVNLRWPVEKYITFMAYNDGWPHLYRINAGGGRPEQITSGHFEVRQLSFSETGEHVLFSANAGPHDADIDRSHIGIANVRKATFRMLTSGTNIETNPLFLGGSDEIAFLQGAAAMPFRPVQMNIQTGRRTETGGSFFDEKLYQKFVMPEPVCFKAADGTEVKAQFYSLKENAKSKSRAAVVYVHGGPRRQMYLGWHPIDYYHYDYMVNQYLAMKGVDVLVVNYRMGTGYGFDFQHPAEAGTLGASEYQDIVAAGEWLLAKKHIDSARLGLFGGSYGGYLTAMALGRNPELFRFGVDIHGVHTREKPRNLDFFPPDFELAADIAWKSSPSKYVDTWTAPVLIIHGDDDQNVSFAQSIDLVNRLLDRGVEVDVMAIPDENHHWMLHENLIRVKRATVNYILQKSHGKRK